MSNDRCAVLAQREVDGQRATSAKSLIFGWVRFWHGSCTSLGNDNGMVRGHPNRSTNEQEAT